MATTADADERHYRRRLLATGAAYALGHHLGLLPSGSARSRGSSWVDWADLLLPYAVLGLAASTLLAAGPGRRTWLAFATGAILYVQGHGIHLAANSIGNAQPSATAHLWDELAGHAIWYAGVAVVAAALAATMASRPASWHPAGLVVAAGAGATWASNAVGGHFVGPGLVLAVVAAGSGASRRYTLAGLFAVAGLSALAAFAVAAAFG